MKRIFTLFICWVMVTSANAQIIDSIKPVVSLKTSIIIDGQTDVYYLSKNLNSFGSINNKKQRLNIDERFTKFVYNTVFKDSLIFEKYRNILLKEGIVNPLIKINKCFINSKIILFCSGVNLKPIINQLGQPDNLIYPFYFVVTINKNTFLIESIRSIGNLPNEEYYLLENGDFLEKNDTLYFTVAREEIIEKNSKILGTWVNKGTDSLVFNSFARLNIPNYFKVNNLNYNLISFSYSSGYILFNTVNSIYSVSSGEEIGFKIKTPANIYRNIMNADVEINAINLSVEVDNNFINVLRRQNESLYFTRLKRSDGSLVQDVKLPDSISKCTENNDNTCYINNGVLYYVDEQQKNVVRYKIE